MLGQLETHNIPLLQNLKSAQFIISNWPNKHRQTLNNAGALSNQVTPEVT